MHEYIDHVLGSYFSDASESSEDEAIDLLRRHLEESPLLSSGLRPELECAFKDEGFSWKGKLEEHGVIYLETEAEAREYAIEILWTPYFGEADF